MSFVDRHGLWTDEQAKAAREVARRIEADGVQVMRLSFADQHGLLRGKTIIADMPEATMRAGCNISSTLLLKDTSHQTVFGVFADDAAVSEAFRGASDMVMVPDPSTFRILPWAPHTGWLLCDLYHPDGRPIALSTRTICRDAMGRLRDLGFDLLTGLEVEFHVFRQRDPSLGVNDTALPGRPGAPISVEHVNQGYQYLTELRYDAADQIFELLRTGLQALDLPLRSLEIEFGPSQLECTFDPRSGLVTSDNMILFRSAVKQICQRNGYHATFMCRPRLPDIASSGWHLHQSLIERSSGNNAFVGQSRPMSDLAEHYLAGLLAHGRASTAITTPTINGYKRYRPNSLAPDRVNWGQDNRGVMIRAIGQPGDPSTRFENRVGEPTANPYLYIAVQALSGLDGIQRSLRPPQSADLPYQSPADLLPRTLGEALTALAEDTWLCDALGTEFVACFDRIKRAELLRFDLDVSDWEQREYFNLF
jgi:glutamine synthetase